MLDNRLRLHYRSLAADSGESAAAPTGEKRSTRRRSRVRLLLAGAVVLLLAVGVCAYHGTSLSDSSSANAVATFHKLVVCAHQPADRTYRVTFVKDVYDTAEVPGIIRPNDAARLPLRDAAAEAMLHVRDGRQFLYSWISPDGRKFAIGGNGQSSWAIRPDAPPQIGDPLHYTGGLPAGLYLAPILSFFDGQEQMLLSHYDIVVRSRDKVNQLFVAMKKPDTKQGPRRIEILFSMSTQVISEMRIWPATPDHRRTNHTLIELVSEQVLDADFFTPEFHEQRIRQKVGLDQYQRVSEYVALRGRDSLSRPDRNRWGNSRTLVLPRLWPADKERAKDFESDQYPPFTIPEFL